MICAARPSSILGRVSHTTGSHRGSIHRLPNNISWNVPSARLHGKVNSTRAQIWKKVKERPIEYLSVPCVAAFVGITTNWMGVKMLFYPIDYRGIDARRWNNTPYGIFGWQGVVPCKTEIMAQRLVNIVTTKLLSLEEAFGRLCPDHLSSLLLPIIQTQIEQDCGAMYGHIMKPVLPLLLPLLLCRLQDEINQVLDLNQVVLQAFVRDKEVLVDLFQKVGRVELEFLVNSGFGFGALLGLGQMLAWAFKPAVWTLPVAGALVGWITNAIAIKLLFEPAEPINVANLLVVQGLFESRQVEVSDEFGDFMNNRVLNSQSLLQDLASGGDQGSLFSFLRRHLPYPVPEQILSAAIKAIAKVADHPLEYPEVHQYVMERLDIENTLSRRLKLLSPKEFEDLLHPVFQEDEITLIATGGVLGLAAGALQTHLGWGGPGATRKAWATIVFCLASSLGLYCHQKYEEVMDEPIKSSTRPDLRRRETIVRSVGMEETIPLDPASILLGAGSIVRVVPSHGSSHETPSSS